MKKVQCRSIGKQNSCSDVLGGVKCLISCQKINIAKQNLREYCLEFLFEIWTVLVSWLITENRTKLLMALKTLK
jgi:hypothetical protein